METHLLGVAAARCALRFWQSLHRRVAPLAFPPWPPRQGTRLSVAIEEYRGRLPRACRDGRCCHSSGHEPDEFRYLAPEQVCCTISVGLRDPCLQYGDGHQLDHWVQHEYPAAERTF